MTKLKDITKGTYFKKKADSNVVWVRGDYVRAEGKYECHKFDDVNSFTYMKGEALVVVDFTF